MSGKQNRWLGITIVSVGVVAAAAGVLYWRHATPQPGDEIDRETITLDDKTPGTIVIRAEAGGERSFVELRTGDVVRWQALIPHYVGTKERRAFAWGRDAITVRVDRDGQAEVFALRMSDGDKLGGFRLATKHEPIHVEPTGPITLHDDRRSYEFVGGPGWHVVVAVDLGTGKEAWEADLGPGSVTAASLLPSGVLEVGARHFDAATGKLIN